MAKTVMIVEDNELNMKLFRDLIEASGYETVRTRNGLEALDLARAHRPDLILMDLGLPVLDGWEATKRIKSEGELKHIPVIAITSRAMVGDEKQARAVGCDECDGASSDQRNADHFEPCLCDFFRQTDRARKRNDLGHRRNYPPQFLTTR